MGIMTTTFKVKVEIDGHVPDDKCFYVMFDMGKIVNITDIKEAIKEVCGSALYYVDEYLKSNNLVNNNATS